MTDFIYSLIYIFPVLLLAGSAYFEDAAPVPFMLCIAALAAFLINADRKLRVIIAGSLIALLGGVILVTERESLEEWLADKEWIWPALVMTACAVAVGALMVRLRPARYVCGVLAAGLLVVSYQTKTIDTGTGVVSIVFLIITIIFEEIRYRCRGSENIRTYVVRIIPFILIGMVGLYNMPYSDRPYDWAMARRIIRRIEDKVTVFMQSFREDSVGKLDNSLGFSENADIGGNVGGEPEEMMVIVADSDVPGYIYLDGKYFDKFDGRKWSEGEQNYPYMMDTIEVSCAASMIDWSVTHDFYKYSQLTVTYTGQITRYLFAPVKTLASGIRIPDTVIDHSGRAILFDRKLGNTTTYKAEYLTLNHNAETLPLLIMNGSEIDKVRWDQVCRRHGLTEAEYSYEEFLRYRAGLYEESRKAKDELRAGLSPEVTSFLDNALDGADSDYEKLAALEHAFTDFEYTTSPGALPDEIDSPSRFLDYFILNERKGYCNSYATAFVLLCMAEGIPARYVHGYCVPMADGKTARVFNSMAHAYAEAYVEGIGWTVFDPTPGYGFFSSWDPTGKYEFPDFTFAREEHHTEEQIPEPEDTPETEGGLRWYMVVVPIALCLAVLVVLAFVERALFIRRFNRMDRDARADSVCRRITRMLKRKGFVRDEGETVREYAVRISAQTDISLSGFVTAFEKLRYSAEQVTEDEYSALCSEYTSLKDTLKGFERILTAFWA